MKKREAYIYTLNGLTGRKYREPIGEKKKESFHRFCVYIYTREGFFARHPCLNRTLNCRNDLLSIFLLLLPSTSNRTIQYTGLYYYTSDTHKTRSGGYSTVMFLKNRINDHQASHRDDDGLTPSARYPSVSNSAIKAKDERKRERERERNLSLSISIS